MPRPDGQPNSLLRWALKIAWNFALDEIRRRRPAPASSMTIEVAPGSGIERIRPGE